MLNKQTKQIFYFKILKFLLLSPILISIPFLNNINVAKAGLEFQWDQDSNFRKLKWFQKDSERMFRNTIYFFLRRNDRQRDLLKITLAIPKTFKTKIKTEKISLCKVKIGGFESRTKCIEKLPADVEIEIKDDHTSVDIYPYKPIPSDKDSYSIVLKAINPRKTGLYQFHSYGQYSGQSASNYLGSWTVVID